MNFIDKLNLQKKLYFLLTIFIATIATITYVGYINISAMKKNLDNLYFGSLVPVVELKDIISSYQNDFESAISEAKLQAISFSEARDRIISSQNIITQKFDSYALHFKRDEELAYLSYAQKELDKSLIIIAKVLDISQKNEDFSRISMSKIHLHVNHMQSVIQKLITYEIDIAYYERQSLLQRYDNTVFIILSVLIASLVAVIILTVWVFSSIKLSNKVLEITTIKLKESNEKLEKSSYVDELTQTFNRRYFNIVYKRELARAKRNHSVLTFMMIDIDNFKLYNDTYGHLEGDKVLKTVSKELKSSLNRPGDYIFRFGGEEFAIILADSDTTSVEMLCQGLVESVENLHTEHKRSDVSEFVTISLGAVSVVPHNSLDENIIIAKSDENLYIAKNEGKNRAIYATEVN